MIIKILLVNIISLFFTLTSAHAYLDPGTGSIILQGIIGAIAAVATFLKFYWHKVLKILGVKKKIIVEQKKDNEDKGT
ncbi:hypothetical protein N9A23_00465 [Candidatus Pelagibacter sp.]|jgi:hypothetical protein|nr:hypothetical protein [Candidatus Pelagibacter sp.]